MIIGNKKFDIKNKTYIMGILNVTPDSFSDGGKYNSLDKALFHTEKMIKEGAAIIDVGGESTRPGHIVISDTEETERVIPVIEAIKSRFDIPVSIDTYKSTVAELSLKAGADIVNDIWGFKADSEMAKITKKYNAVCCLMHNRKEAVYNNFVSDVIADLKESIEIALKAGIDNDKIIIDSGVGFGKTYENNIEIIRESAALSSLGYPVLWAVSRKSVIGLTLNLPPEQRVEGTLALTVLGVINKCSFVRVHDIKENKRVIDMTEKILGRS